MTSDLPTIRPPSSRSDLTNGRQTALAPGGPGSSRAVRPAGKPKGSGLQLPPVASFRLANEPGGRTFESCRAHHPNFVGMVTPSSNLGHAPLRSAQSQHDRVVDSAHLCQPRDGMPGACIWQGVIHGDDRRSQDVYEAVDQRTDLPAAQRSAAGVRGRYRGLLQQARGRAPSRAPGPSALVV